MFVYKLLLVAVVMVQPAAQQIGIGFFKLVNKSDVTIEVEISDGKKFTQIALVKPKKDHLMAVREGTYTYAIRGNEDKKSCDVTAGNIIQIDFPLTAKKEVAKTEDLPKKEVAKTEDLPKKEVAKTEDLPKKEVAKTEDLPMPKIEEPKPGIKTALVEINGLPEDAELWFNTTKASTATQRWFKTPELELDREYFYILRAEVRRNDRIYVDRKHVIVRPGQKSIVTFNLPK